MTPYLQFDRNQWAALRDSVPMTLSEDEIARLKGINEDLVRRSCRDLFTFVTFAELLYKLESAPSGSSGTVSWYQRQRIPYIISIAGSVAVGKSTTARIAGGY